MKVYVVQCLIDIHNKYSAMDDTEIYIYNDLEIAKLKLFEKYEEKKTLLDFLGYSDEEDQYDIVPNSFFLTDGQDYYSGRIIEKEVF